MLLGAGVGSLERRSEAKISLAGLKLIVRELIFAVVVVTFREEIPGFCPFTDTAVRNTKSYSRILKLWALLY